jgi:hypothetical protein
MKDTKKIQKNYDALSIDERFKLLFNALQRGDDIEVQALNKTDPEKTWRVSSLRGLQEAFIFLTTFHAIKQLSQTVNFLHMHAFHDEFYMDFLTPMAKKASKEAGKKIKPQEIYSAIYQQTGLNILTMDAAYREVCRDWGIDADRMLSLYKEYLNTVDIMLGTISRITKDAPMELVDLQEVKKAYEICIEEQRKQWELIK